MQALCDCVHKPQTFEHARILIIFTMYRVMGKDLQPSSRWLMSKQ